MDIYYQSTFTVHVSTYHHNLHLQLVYQSTTAVYFYGVQCYLSLQSTTTVTIHATTVYFYSHHRHLPLLPNSTLTIHYTTSLFHSPHISIKTIYFWITIYLYIFHHLPSSISIYFSTSDRSTTSTALTVRLPEPFNFMCIDKYIHNFRHSG